MEKPYVRKLDQIEEIAVWIVDGVYIRKNIDEEFTNFGQHYRFRFIPMREFWIDQEHGPGEQQFFIDHARNVFLALEHEQAGHQSERQKQHDNDDRQLSTNGHTTAPSRVYAPATFLR